MAAYDVAAGANRAAQAVSDFRAGTNPYWNDSYLNMGASILQADMANAHELEMWNLNNEYNTPAAQMQRMKDAGLNPMLFYQQGNPGNSSSAPATHSSNAKITPHQDTLARIQGVLGIIGSFNQMLSQAFGVTEQAQDVLLKRNELAFSNFDIAGARQIFDGFGSRDFDKVRFRQDFDYASAFNPNSANFNPALAGFAQRLGLSGSTPRFMTAEANAYLSGKRADYQDWYNTKLAPLIENYYSGRNNIQDIRKGMLEYEKQMLDVLPPEIRAIVLPLFDYVRPFINSLLRR